ncbi:dTDP-4-dehydrorhamnose reductase [Mixta mediterraneensis]|uniref:dTDP-4-dehydrorhamnose reductase n=1 Tax=Mixta mediterraneensis TaxID=2758443 RepID=UPI001876F138|nr:dTDP-4-dehydrorhamnose reductase [Mixta mediterraneensis]MBE5252423.1 dTDP-4-dehydrorhamnose reductase [Mixta mediterraneensis]
MNILLFGKNGQVGWELQRALAPLGNLIALDRHSTDYCGDFENPTGIAETVRKLQPTVIVNATAYTAVDKAESEQEKAQLINATTLGALAGAAETCGAWLVHYSTDYVFDGSGDTPWKESDTTAPLNVYGQTKLEGEQAIARNMQRYLIFRTSWVYAARGNNFAKTMIRLAKDRDTLSVINDQFGAPTGADLIADSTAHAIRVALDKPEVSGLYHLIAAGTTTWYDYASKVIHYAQSKGIALNVKTINPVSTSAFPTPAKRPGNSRLDTRKFRETFALTLPDWETGVTRLIDELYA